jgi:hypothetical protein
MSANLDEESAKTRGRADLAAIRARYPELLAAVAERGEAGPPDLKIAIDPTSEPAYRFVPLAEASLA